MKKMLAKFAKNELPKSAMRRIKGGQCTNLGAYTNCREAGGTYEQCIDYCEYVL